MNLTTYIGKLLLRDGSIVDYWESAEDPLHYYTSHSPLLRWTVQGLNGLVNMDGRWIWLTDKDAMRKLGEKLNDQIS